jgi:poly(A) polymerase
MKSAAVRNCFLIGRRFRLAHFVFGRKVIVTSTFRRHPDAVENENGLYQTEDNTFGSPEEDAKRRDFTVNGLFYEYQDDFRDRFCGRPEGS